MKRKRIGWAIAILIASGLAYCLYDGMMRSYGPYGTVIRTACMSNLKQIGRSMAVYTADNDGRLPPGECWMDAVAPLLIVPDVLRCPCLKRAGVEGYGYAFNSEMSKVFRKSIELPEHMPLVYESKATHRNASDNVTSFSGPHDAEVLKSDRANMLFMDGHVERLEKE